MMVGARLMIRKIAWMGEWEFDTEPHVRPAYDALRVVILFKIKFYL